MLPPLKFRPILKERVWGGRKLEVLYGKPLPPSVPIGESWEISDRPGDVSVVATGPLAGRDLRWLMEKHPRDLLGDAPAQEGRFPWLIKILDARETLSLQVHPPASLARSLGGEPKTEMWYIAHAEPGAELFAGLKRGLKRADFEQRLRTGGVADCFHRLPVGAGDALFLPSGRVHAIGAGLVIFEIQQNSDTTYRVYDWDRVGLDGKPRTLHVEEALRSIDFTDFEPPLASRAAQATAWGTTRTLAQDPLFTVDWWEPRPGRPLPLHRGHLAILAIVSGIAALATDTGALELGPGDFALVPANTAEAHVTFRAPGVMLWVRPGNVPPAR
jgi:mannose-6-phosphate isomerase